jgi:hypothetical protein
MLASDVIASVSNDVRNVLGTSGASATVLLDYVDRIQKDCLHDSIYAYLARSVQTINTVNGTSAYTLTGNLRSIISVYDRTRNRIMLPFLGTSAPIPFEQEVPAGGPAGTRPPEAQMAPRDVMRLKSVSSAQPEYWQYTSTNLLTIYPTPLTALILEITTETQTSTITTTSTTLIMPDDSKDMVVAGVNYLANLFLSREQHMQAWMTLYQKLKAGESIV